MNHRILIFLVLVLFFYNPSLYAMGTRPARRHILVRVLIVKSAKEINLHIRGPYRLVGFEDGEVLEEGRGLRSRTFFAKDLDSGGIRVLPGKRARVYVNKRQFRGEIDIIKDKEQRLIVVNNIDIEEYLYGVLYNEVSHRWPIEVLKAQAIAARTYALYQKLVSKNRYFDLAADIYSQVYGGRRSETWSIRRAVNLTRGQILTYNGKIFPSYYHATCGGHTSDAVTLWGIDIPPLRGRPCNFCTMSPYYRWKKELRIDEITDRLKQAGYDIQLVSIEALKRDKAGRILDVLLKGRPENIKLGGNKFRLIVGPNLIKSTNFKAQIKGRDIIFEGKGWGHGIGMCQWGAYAMARKGYKAEDILRYYYPGTEIVRIGNN